MEISEELTLNNNLSSTDFISAYRSDHFAVISVILSLLLFVTFLAMLWPSPQRIPAFPWRVKPWFLYLTLSTMKWLKPWPHCFLLPAAQQALVFSAPGVRALLLVFYPTAAYFQRHLLCCLVISNKIAISEPSSSSELSVRFQII